MSAEYQPSPQFNQWLAAAAEGNLDAESAEKLGRLLRSDEAARAYYVEYMSVHALLQWRHGGVGPLEMPLEMPLEVPLAAPAALERDRRKRAAFWPAAGVAVAVLLAVSLAVLLAGRPWGGSDSNQQYIAVVLRHDAGQWSDGTSLAGEQPLRRGRQRLAAGQARIELTSGVLLAVEGPVDFELSTPDRIHLHRGKLRVYSPLAARGFTVTTPRGVQIVDLGTEFGVWSAADHSVQIHLFEGKLQINGGRILTSSQAVQIGADGAMQAISADETLFPSLHGAYDGLPSPPSD